MISLPRLCVSQRMLSRGVLIPAFTRSASNLPLKETSFSTKHSAAFSPALMQIADTFEQSRAYLFSSLTCGSNAVILAPFMASALPDVPELLMSSIIKKRKKKMNKHKWKKRRRLVRYKNKA
jgi:hypothetical protein